MGYYTTAYSPGSTALGYNTTAGGEQPFFAIGKNSQSTGGGSVALGYGANAIGPFSAAIGLNTYTSGSASFATGHGTSAIGDYSTAMGDSSMAMAQGCTALGVSAYASGNTYGASTAMGFHTNASGDYSTAMGKLSVASGMSSTAIGESTAAIGNYSTAIGYYSSAKGEHSTVIGSNIIAEGRNNIGISLSDSFAYTVSQDNTLAIMGGNVGIGSGTPNTLLYVSAVNDVNVLTLKDSDGTCTFNPESTATDFVCTSDARLKSDITDAQPALAEIMKFRIREFTVKASGDKAIGVIAQEVRQVAPDMVSTGPDGYLMVSQPNPWKIVKSIQELKAENDGLKSENTAQQDQIDAQQKQIDELKSIVCLDHPEAEACK